MDKPNYLSKLGLLLDDKTKLQLLTNKNDKKEMTERQLINILKQSLN